SNVHVLGLTETNLNASHNDNLFHYIKPLSRHIDTAVEGLVYFRVDVNFKKNAETFL
ncbi:hypothetical protein ACJMK2_033613, partial [Sinanodonta woodiana]